MILINKMVVVFPSDIGLMAMEPFLTYSAHYKRDPHTGEIFNFGITAGISPALTATRSSGGLS